MHSNRAPHDGAPSPTAALPPLDLALAAEACRLSERPPDGVLATGAGELPFVITERGHDGMILLVQADPGRGRAWLRFARNERAAAGVVSIKIAATQAFGTGVRVWAKYRTAFAASEAALVDLVVHRLLLAALPTRVLRRAGRQWAYDIAARGRRPATRTMMEKLDELRETRPGRLRLHATWRSGHHQGRANIHRAIEHELMATTRGRSRPQMGAEIQLRCELPDGPITLIGQVESVVRGPRTKNTVTVRIFCVEDLADGRRWRNFLTSRAAGSTTTRPYEIRRLPR